MTVTCFTAIVYSCIVSSSLSESEVRFVYGAYGKQKTEQIAPELCCSYCQRRAASRAHLPGREDMQVKFDRKLIGRLTTSILCSSIVQVAPKLVFFLATIGREQRIWLA